MMLSLLERLFAYRITDNCRARQIGSARLAVLFFWALLNVSGQVFRIGNASTLQGTAFDPGTKNIYAIWQDSIRIFNAPDYTESKLIPFQNPKADFPRRFIPLFARDSLYFVNRGDDLVLVLDGTSLTPISQPGRERIQNASSLLVKNDTLFRFGGNGFWTTWSHLTYFDWETGIWNLLPPKNSRHFPPGLANPIFLAHQNEFYVMSGWSENKTNPMIKEINREVWKFDVSNKTWEFQGPSKTLTLPNDMLFVIDFAQLLQINNEFALIDPVNNLITYHDKKPSVGNLFLDDHIKPFYSDGTVFVVRYENIVAGSSPDRNLVYEAVPVSYFLGNPYREEPLYASAEDYELLIPGLILGILLVGGSIVLIKRFRNKAKINVFHSHLEYKGVVCSPTSLELLVLREFLAYGGQLDVARTLELANVNGNVSNNAVSDSTIIDSLNWQLKTLVGKDSELITKTRSSSDRRIKHYTLDPSRFSLR